MRLNYFVAIASYLKGHLFQAIHECFVFNLDNMNYFICRYIFDDKNNGIHFVYTPSPHHSSKASAMAKEISN